MKKIYFSQDMSRWAEKSPIIEAYDNHFIVNVDKKDYEGPVVSLIGDKGVFYTGLEYMKVEKQRTSFFDEISSVEISGEISFLMTTTSLLKSEVFKVLRSATSGYVILMGPMAQRINRGIDNFRKSLESYEEAKEDLELLYTKLDKAKKEDKEEKVEKISKQILRFKAELKELRKESRASAFMIDFFMEAGVFNVFRGFEPIYSAHDVMVLKVLPRMRQGITNSTIGSFLTCQEESIKKDLSENEVVDLIVSYTRSSEVSFKYEVPERQGSLDLLSNISEFPDLTFESSIYMTDARPVAPIRPNIVASLLASGTAGKLDRDVIINEEECTIKSVMLQHDKVSSSYINGEEVTEKISTWKPKLGIFNKLRKEIEILED